MEKKTRNKRSRSTIKKLALGSKHAKGYKAIIQKIIESLSDKKKLKIPFGIKPMLATLVDEPFNKEGWLYEVKWDGFRLLAYINDGKVELRSRNDKSFNEKFYPVFNELKEWNVNTVLDGEIIVANEYGLADFGALQTWRSEADGKLIYYIFDILWLEGYDLMHLPLKERREILQKILPDSKMIKVSESFDAKGTDFFSLAEKMNLEGIIAKKADSPYRPDIRSKQWLKIKTVKNQEAIIAGYTRNENTSKPFSALLMGIHENGKLNPIAPIGTGFSIQLQNEIIEKLRPLETSVCPFPFVPDFNKPSRFRPNPPRTEVTWVKPELVAEFSYRTVAPDGSFRHPAFKGLREDKSAKDVRREKPVSLSELVKKDKDFLTNKVISHPDKIERKTLLNPKDETQVRNIGGHDLKFTNLSKIFWPEENISKRDMLNYYYQAVPYLLPYMKGRPQTLNRFPNGIYGKSFYQKDVTDKVPDWIEKYPYYSETEQRQKNFLICTDEASLLYIASLGCIEMNPWSSRIQSPDHPDWCIIDLDPDKTTFDQVVEAALVTKKVLDVIGVPGYCKTSGSTGLHIYIPLGAKYSYEDSKEFGRALVKVVHSEIPAFTTIERYTSKRNGKMYLDFLQNRPQATVAAPYSLRPKPGATVSMPLHWEEVKIGMKMQDFHLRNAIDRMKEQGDLFKGVLGKGINMEKARMKLAGLMND